MPCFRVAIVGGGIAGLTMAIALRRKGHQVTVIERHAGCQTVGAPVTLGANATRVLIAYGMGPVLSKYNVMNGNAFVYRRRYDNGEVITSRTSESSLTESFGAPYIIPIPFAVTYADIYDLVLG